MRRYSALPAICLALFFLNLPFNAMAQDAGPQPTDVVYLLPDATLATYVINRATGIPALKGLTTLDVTGYTTIVPSPDDHFLYIFGFNPISGNSQLLVYPTDRDGVPRTRPIQRIDFPYLPFRIDPNMRYAYVVDYDDKALEWNFLQFPINPRTGMVQAPRLVAQESQYGPCSQWVPGAPAINGFSPTGDQLYEEWSCSSIEDTEFYYYTRQVDPRTGALSDAVSTVQTFGNGGGGTSVNITPNAILEFDTYDCCSLAVLPLSGGTPLFTCTGEMLQACGNAVGIDVDPEGKDIFFQVVQNSALCYSGCIYQIARLLLKEEEVVSTGYSLPPMGSLAFSPDDALLYAGADLNNETLDIFVFNPDTGAVRPGGQIHGPKSGFAMIPALRR